MLKYFKIDQGRCQLVVPTEFYQANLSKALEYARREDPELFRDGDSLGSWSKFAKDPIRSKGLYTRMLKSFYFSQENIPELDADLQVGIPAGISIDMMFLSGSITNKNLILVSKITEQTLPGYRVLVISGEGVYSGKKICNRNAEKITKSIIEECRENNTPLLIISRGMAQRSYSIGEIGRVLLCYDEGDSGATMQKIARVLTPSTSEKIGRIFSMSFDPNRDDKFDTLFIASAQNYAKRKNIDIDEALRCVIKVADIFACSADGRVEIDADAYLQQLLSRSSLTRLVGKQADLSQLSFTELTALANGNAHYNHLDRVDATERGQIGQKKGKSVNGVSEDKDAAKLLDQARKVLATIVEHLPYLAFMTKTDSVRASLIKCNEIDDYKEYVTEEFGATPEQILDFFDRGILNYDLASLQKSAKTFQLKA